MKTSELTGRALDWAVAKAAGATDLRHDGIGTWWFTLNGKDWALSSGWSVQQNWDPSINWRSGGPIIEREKLFVKPTINRGWRAYQRDPFGNGICNSQYGPTPLVAALRCHVASKLGDNVDIPEELKP